MFRLLANKIVGTVYLNCAVTNITTSGWVTLLAKIPVSCSGVEIFNPSGAKLQLSIGAAGHETDAANLLTYTVLPGGSTGVLPMNLPNGTRLSVQALDQNITTDYLVLNFFG